MLWHITLVGLRVFILVINKAHLYNTPSCVNFLYSWLIAAGSVTANFKGAHFARRPPYPLLSRFHPTLTLTNYFCNMGWTTGESTFFYGVGKDFPVVHLAYTEFESYLSSYPACTKVLFLTVKVAETRNWRLSCICCWLWLVAEVYFAPHSSSYCCPSVLTRVSHFITLLWSYVGLSCNWLLWKDCSIKTVHPTDLVPHVRYIAEGCTHFGCQVALETEFSIAAPNICRFSVWNFLHVNFQGSRSLRWIADFCKTYAPLT